MSSYSCLKCKRPLSDRQSIQRGFGPVCYAKVMAERAREEAQNELPLLPFEGDIVCRRTERGTQFNIPQVIKYHSPTGMEWGYGGSGPADFALNILARFTDEDTARRLHQEFKWQFVANLPREGGTIKRQDIIDFITNNGGTLNAYANARTAE